MFRGYKLRRDQCRKVLQPQTGPLACVLSELVWLDRLSVLRKFCVLVWYRVFDCDLRYIALPETHEESSGIFHR